MDNGGVLDNSQSQQNKKIKRWISIGNTGLWVYFIMHVITILGFVYVMELDSRIKGGSFFLAVLAVVTIFSLFLGIITVLADIYKSRIAMFFGIAYTCFVLFLFRDFLHQGYLIYTPFPISFIIGLYGLIKYHKLTNNERQTLYVNRSEYWDKYVPKRIKGLMYFAIFSAYFYLLLFFVYTTDALYRAIIVCYSNPADQEFVSYIDNNEVFILVGKFVSCFYNNEMIIFIFMFLFTVLFHIYKTRAAFLALLLIIYFYPIKNLDFTGLFSRFTEFRCISIQLQICLMGVTLLLTLISVYGVIRYNKMRSIFYKGEKKYNL